MISKFKLVTIGELFQKSINLIVFLACLSFTLYQSYMCLAKYQGYPKGTSIKFLPPGKVGNNFPAITFCSQIDTVMELHLAFNETELKKCYGGTSGTGR